MINSLFLSFFFHVVKMIAASSVVVVFAIFPLILLNESLEKLARLCNVEILFCFFLSKSVPFLNVFDTIRGL
jgi:hypothetical protein